MQVVSAKWSPADGSKVAVARRATGRYLTPEEIEALAFAAPHRKLAQAFTKDIQPLIRV